MSWRSAAVPAALALAATGALGVQHEGPAPEARTAERRLPEVLISRQLGEAWNIRAGDMVRLSHGAAPDGRTFRVAGLYEPAPDPMQLSSARYEVRLHLPDLIDLTADPRDPQAREAAGSLNVALADPGEAEAFARDLSARVPGLVVRPAVSEERSGTFLALERFHLAIALVTVIASTIFLLALMVMLVEERRRVVATLRLIGLPPRRVLLLVLAEGLIIASAGAAFGLVVALGTEPLINRFFQWRYDTAMVFVRIGPGILWRCVALAVPLGLAASVLSSWALLRRNILGVAGR